MLNSCGKEWLKATQRDKKLADVAFVLVTHTPYGPGLNEFSTESTSVDLDPMLLSLTF